MFPFFTVWWAKIYMTGIGIVISFITFVIIVWYLSKRFLQGFWKFFYWLPLAITLVYFLWSYVQFVLSNQAFIPTTIEQIISIIWPYWYKFHFAWILLGIVISLFVFFKKIKTIENKKIWADIFFYWFALCIVPLWFFLLLGDNFIWKTTDSFFAMKSLHMESQWNKFDGVYPIGLLLSIWSLLIVIFMHIRKIIWKKRGIWMQWLALLLIMMNIILMMQQYPRYMVISVGNISFDIKQHISFFVIMLCLYYHKKRNTPKPILEN